MPWVICPTLRFALSKVCIAGASSVAQWVECWPTVYEALGSIPRTAQTKPGASEMAQWLKSTAGKSDHLTLILGTHHVGRELNFETRPLIYTHTQGGTCHPSTWEVESGGSEVLGLSRYVASSRPVYTEIMFPKISNKNTRTAP